MKKRQYFWIAETIFVAPLQLSKLCFANVFHCPMTNQKSRPLDDRMLRRPFVQKPGKNDMTEHVKRNSLYETEKKYLL